jgi:DNA-binding transcriptional LysR family regulator
MRSGLLRLPPANSLVAFEATARHLSFKEAARELKVTSAALSRQIRILEDDLGCRLFERLHRAIRLTPDGRRLQQAVDTGLGGIAACVGELRAPARTEQVSIASSFAFATLWLMPRIGRFILEHPDIELRYVVVETIGDDFAEDVDIRFRYGVGRWPGHTADKLYDDEILAVCSPDYLKRRPALRTPADLLGERLIHLENVDPRWEDWSTWFRALGIKHPPRKVPQRMNSYIVAVQAAIDGVGVALGWRHMVEGYLRQGLLVPAVDAAVPTVNAYYQTYSAQRPLGPAAQELHDWLARETR